nr:MAG: hypothetical protein [Bacteriophage sp.]
MDKAYLVELNADGTRKKTYAKGIFYQVEETQPIKEYTKEGTEQITGYTEEKIISLVDGFNVQEVLSSGGKWLSDEEYINLLRTNIYKEGADNA